MESYITAAAGIVSLMTSWILIQLLWRKEFSEHVQDEDALAERTKCTNCGCTTVCKKKGKLLTNHKVR